MNLHIIDGLVAIFFLFSLATFLGEIMLSKAEKSLLKHLKRALRRTADVSGFETLGTESSCFSGTGTLPYGVNKRIDWGINHTSEFNGKYRKDVQKDCFDFHLVKRTTIERTDADRVVASTLVSETMFRDGQFYMRFSEAPDEWYKLFPRDWFLVGQHDLGHMINVDGIMEQSKFFDDSMLEEGGIEKIEEIPGEEIAGKRTRCIKVTLNSDPASESDGMFANAVPRGLGNNMCSRAVSWTQYFISEPDHIVVAIRTSGETSEVKVVEQNYAFQVEMSRNTVFTSLNVPMILPSIDIPEQSTPV